MKLMTTLVVAALVGLVSATDATFGTEPNAAAARKNLRGGNRMAPTPPVAAVKPASPHAKHHHHPSTSHPPTESARPARGFASTLEDPHAQRPKAPASPKARSPHHDEWHPATSHPPTTAPRPAAHRESFVGIDTQDDVKHPARTTTPHTSPRHSRQPHPATSHPPKIDRKPVTPDHERKPADAVGGRELLSEPQPRESSELNRVPPVNGVPVEGAPQSPRHARHPGKAHPPVTAPPTPRPVVVREFVAETNQPQRHPKPVKKHHAPAPPASPHHQRHTTQPPVNRVHV